MRRRKRLTAIGALALWARADNRILRPGMRVLLRAQLNDPALR